MSIIYDLLLKEEKSLMSKLEQVRNEMKKFQTSSDTAVEYIASNVSKPITNDLIDENQVKKYSTPQKILFALKENNRFMKIREIAEYISGLTSENVDELVKQMSRRTKYLKEKDKIVKFQLGNKKANTFWGSPKWMDNDGNIKKDHMYNPSVALPKNQIKLIDL